MEFEADEVRSSMLAAKKNASETISAEQEEEESYQSEANKIKEQAEKDATQQADLAEESVKTAEEEARAEKEDIVLQNKKAADIEAEREAEPALFKKGCPLPWDLGPGTLAPGPCF